MTLYFAFDHDINDRGLPPENVYRADNPMQVARRRFQENPGAHPVQQVLAQPRQVGGLRHLRGQVDAAATSRVRGG